MSDKSTSLHLRDINNPPTYLNKDQQKSWISAAVKAKKNHQLQQQYPSFTIPSAMYEVKYVNKYTTIDVMKLLVHHVEDCQEYTIDTEGEKSTNEVVLIQVETIPRELPIFVIIFELKHLPSDDSPSNVMIKKLFQLIFRPGNKLYSWGPLGKELSLINDNSLFEWPIEASTYDIQLLFSDWYDWARSRCGASCLSFNHNPGLNDNIPIGSNKLSSICPCHGSSPYRLNEKWSLQQALIYAAGMFIDKSATLSRWSTLLDPRHSTLSDVKREQMEYYMIYDCFATTYLVKPVLEYWTFEELSKINIVKLFLASQKSSSITNIITNKTISNVKKINKNINGQTLWNVIQDDLESISDEEDKIFINQCNSVMVNNDELCEIISNNNDDDNTPLYVQDVQDTNQEIQLYETISDDELAIETIDDNEAIKQVPSSSHYTKTRGKRSARAKSHRNKKINNIHRQKRFRRYITRPVYNRFPMWLIKMILRRYAIHFVHVKIVEEELVIGLKNDFIKREVEHRLPRDIFNRSSYYYYRRQYRRE